MLIDHCIDSLKSIPEYFFTERDAEVADLRQNVLTLSEAQASLTLKTGQQSIAIYSYSAIHVIHARSGWCMPNHHDLHTR